MSTDAWAQGHGRGEQSRASRHGLRQLVGSMEIGPLLWPLDSIVAGRSCCLNSLIFMRSRCNGIQGLKVFDLGEPLSFRFHLSVGILCQHLQKQRSCQHHQRSAFSAQIEWGTMFLIHYQTLLWHAARCNPEFTTNALPWKGRAMFLTVLTPPSFHHDVNKQLEQGSAKHGITKT